MGKKKISDEKFMRSIPSVSLNLKMGALILMGKVVPQNQPKR